MDNVCHTLLGVAVARAGLKTTTRFATATLAIASNLPDIDVLVFASGIPAVAIRRGWTHGVLAQLTLPILFAGVMWAAGRLKPTAPRAPRPAPSEPRPAPRAPRTAPSAPRPAHFGWLVVLSYIGVLSHVFLDFLNTYGIRLLMPFSSRWFYGDSVFIVDIWLWLMLGVGALLARGARRWPARAALVVATLYIVAMLVSARSARQIVESRWIETTGTPPAALLVGPVPLNPFRKAIIADAGGRYVTGRFNWYPRQIAFSPVDIPKNDDGPWVNLALSQEPDFAYILVWARFPYWTVEREAEGMRITLRDARFPRGAPGFSATTYISRSAIAKHPASRIPHPVH